MSGNLVSPFSFHYTSLQKKDNAISDRQKILSGLRFCTCGLMEKNRQFTWILQYRYTNVIEADFLKAYTFF